MQHRRKALPRPKTGRRWRTVLHACGLAFSALSSPVASQDKLEEHLGLESTFTPLESLDEEVAKSQNYTHGVDLIKDSDGTPFSVSGVRIAIWDTGGILTTHESFGGRIVDAQTHLPSSHATLAAGIIGSGPIARIDLGNDVVGVSDFTIAGYAYCPSATADEDVAEQMRVAFLGSGGNGIPDTRAHVANHSWGFPHCWRDLAQNEETTRAFDDLSYRNPAIVAVVAAGNEGQNGSRLCPATDDVSVGAPLFNSIRSPADAKNVITVGNMVPVGKLLPEIYIDQPNAIRADVTSSKGPAPGGRIKPDVIALGRDIIGPYAQWGGACEHSREFETPSCAEVTERNHQSCIGIQSGTSFSAPFTTGVIGVLQAVSRNKRKVGLRADEAKALLIHSALSSDGRPSYTLGWGPYRADHAANIVAWWNPHGFLPNGAGNVFTRLKLQPGEVREVGVRKRAGSRVRVTTTWLDAPASARVAADGNDLIHDLDIALLPVTEGEGESFHPWKLDPRPGHEGSPATRGVNTRDNVERIDVPVSTALDYDYRLLFDASKIKNEPLEFVVISTGLELTE